MNKFIKNIYKYSVSIFPLIYLLYIAIIPAPAFATGNPFVPTTDVMQTGLTPQIGGEELDTASTDIANFSDISGAYYDANLNRIVFIGTTTGTSKYNQDDMAVAIKSIFYNNTVPDVSIGDDPANPGSATAVVTYSNGLQNTNFGNVLFNTDYKYKQYAVGYTPNAAKLSSTVPTYKSVVDRYLALTSNPIAGNESKYLLSPQIISIKNATSSSSIVFTNVSMHATAQAVNQNNDPLWNQAANNFASDITTNYNQYAQETPYFSQAQQLSKVVAVLKWISDYGIQSDFHSIQNYTPQFVATPNTVQKVTTPTGYSAQGEINYNTPNTYVPDDGTASSLKSSAQAASSSKEDVTWTFINGGKQYTAVAITADAFKSLGAYSTSVSDISVPVSGDLSLTFQRTYNSYSDGQFGIGVGWDMMPARLYPNTEPQPLDIIICSNGNIYLSKLAIDTPNGHETFTYDCTNGYTPDSSSYHSSLVQNSDNTFTVTAWNKVKYNFNANFQLTSNIDKDGNAINYSYDASGKLNSIADTHSHQLTIAYNSQNFISSVTDWSGRKIQYTYDTNGRLISVIDPKNNTTTYGYDNNSKLTTIADRNGQQVLTNTYDGNARIATQKNAAGITTTNNYDTINRVVTQTDSNGRVVKTTYDANARILSQTDPLNKSVIYTYGTETVPLTQIDKNGNKETFTYDFHGNLTTATFPDTTNISYTYDANNRLTKILDNRYSPAKETDYSYDSNGDLTQKTEAGLITQYTYDTTGEMLTTTDPLNNTTTWTRDSLGNKLTEADAYNHVTNYTYDALGRIIKQVDPNNVAVSYTYDDNGNLLTTTDAIGTTTNTYDNENRLLTVKLPNNTVTTYTYNTSGSPSTVIDALNDTTTYGYDNYQNLTTQQDALNHTTTNAYDQLNRQTKSTTPLGNATSWQYDANGNIIQRTDGNGKTTNYQYDTLNHLTKITYPDSSTITYTYDGRGNLVKMVDPNGTSTYTYDTFDRLTQATNSFSQMIKYAYDNADNLIQLTYPDNKVVKYTYDKNNRMVSVTDWNNQVTTYTYNNNGTLATRAYPNGITTYYSYDNANRLTILEHKTGNTSDAKFVYTRDAVGDITSAVESGQFFGSTQTNTFTYDSLGRITQAKYGYPSDTYTYSYDKVGSILTKNDFAANTTFTYDNDNRIAKKGTATYTYDKDGNLTSVPGFGYPTNYTYNFENNLIKNTTGMIGDTYKYDGLGNRYELDDQYSNKTRYVTDITSSQPRTLADYSTTFNQIQNWYVYGIGIIGEWDQYSTNTTAMYYLEDGMGNTRFTTNYTGSVASILTYDPFGANTRQSGGNPAFQYQGQRLDQDTALYYMQARYEDPSSGRFTTRDTSAGDIQNSLTQNPYIYGNDNPINYTDPSGNDAIPQILKNQASGKIFEDYVLKLYGFTKNTGNLKKAGFGYYIPDIDNEERGVGEIKSGSYLSLSPQLRAFIMYAKSTGSNFTLYVRQGIKLSTPLIEFIKANEGDIEAVPFP